MFHIEPCSTVNACNMLATSSSKRGPQRKRKSLKKSVSGGDGDGLALGVVETVVRADVVDEEDTRAQDDEVEEHHQ